MKINILGKPGPKSLAGKGRSKMNAVKSGAFAKTKVLPHECEKEYMRVKKGLIRSLKPSCEAQTVLINEMVDALWSMERFRLRHVFRQEAIFNELTPRQLVEMLGVPQKYWPYAPEYYLKPNTKILARDLKSLTQPWAEYRHMVEHCRGVRNYNMVMANYTVIFDKLDEYMQAQHGRRLLMAHGKAIELDLQQNPRLFEKYLIEYGAWLYYRLTFNDRKPHIRTVMSTWYFLGRMTKKESDFQDEGVTREFRRYQSLMDSYLKLQRSLDDRDRCAKELERK